MIFGLFNLPLCLIGVVYLNSQEIGWTSTWLGFLVLALYIPIWFYSQREIGALGEGSGSSCSRLGQRFR